MAETTGTGTGGVAAAPRASGPSVVDRLAPIRNSEPRIFGMMTLAVVLGVVGAEIRSGQKLTTGKTAPAGAAGVLSDPFMVILGGTAAAAILVAIASFGGTPGAKFGVGLAGLTLIGSILYNGSPVFAALKGATNPASTPTPAPKKGAPA